MTKQKKFKLGPKQRVWIKALKSKKYKQGKLTLHRKKNDSYCCLGVANKVCKLGESENSDVLDDRFGDLGLVNNCGEIIGGFKFPRGNRHYSYLTAMNDSGVTFNKIAEFIETNPELVFTKNV